MESLEQEKVNGLKFMSVNLPIVLRRHYNLEVSEICSAWLPLSYGYSGLYTNTTIKIVSNMAMRMCIDLVMGRSVWIQRVVSTLIEGP